MNRIVGPTLLNSFDWFLTAPDSPKRGTDVTWKQAAFEDIITTIKRLPKEYGPELKKGIEFENAVQHACEEHNGVARNGSEGYMEAVARCRGGKFQEWCNYFFEYEGLRVRAYGKSDVVFPDKIIDIKTTGNYKGAVSYLKGWQPPIHLLATGKSTFEFLVAEWESKDSLKVKKVYEPIIYAAHDNMAQAVYDQYHKFITFLRTNNLYEDYIYTFCKNPRPVNNEVSN